MDGGLNDIVSEAKKNYRASRSHFGDWRVDARKSYAYYAGDQWSQEDRAKLDEQERPIVTFNRTQPIVDAISGYEISNRHEVKYLARTENDTPVNEIYSLAAKWFRDSCGAEDEESDAFRDTIICGMGWTKTWIDYEEDPDGMMKVDRVDPFEMYPDPSAIKKNLSDARWHIRINNMPVSAFKAEWPGVEIKGGTFVDEDRDENPHVVEPEKYNGNTQSGDLVKTVQVVEYQKKVKEEFYRVALPTGEEEISSKAWKEIGDKIEASGAPWVKQKRSVIKTYLIAEDQILKETDGLSKRHYTYQCITGYRDRNKRLWYGVVRNAMDPQDWSNKFFAQIMHIVNSNAKGGLLAEIDAFVNPRDAAEKWSGPDALILLNAGGISKVKERTMGSYPQGLDRLLSFATTSIRDTTGVNLELLGMADRGQAGVLEYQRKQAGLTVLAPLTDSLRSYRKNQGLVVLDLIQEYLSDNRLIRVIGEESGLAQYVPLTKQSSTIKYDVVVDESATSPHQKEMVLAVMKELLPVLGDRAGLVIPEMIKSTPLPNSLAQKLSQAMSPPPDPAAEQAKQLELQGKQADIEKAQSVTTLNYAKAETQGADPQIRAFQVQADNQLRQQQMENDAAFQAEKNDRDFALKVNKTQADLAIKAETARMKTAMKGMNDA